MLFVSIECFLVLVKTNIMKKTLLIFLTAGLSILLPLSSQSREKLNLHEENFPKALKQSAPILFSQSAKKAYLLKDRSFQTQDDVYCLSSCVAKKSIVTPDSFQTGLIDGWPYSYQCGYFYNDDYGNGLPVGIPIWVFSSMTDHTAVFAVGYTDESLNPITIYLTGTFDTVTKYATLYIGFGSLGVTLD